MKYKETIDSYPIKLGPGPLEIPACNFLPKELNSSVVLKKIIFATFMILSATFLFLILEVYL